MKVGVVDIGSNSMRLLITSGSEESGRWVRVTGLGEGVDETGVLSPQAVARTVVELEVFGRLMDSHHVQRRLAIATSASRDASNRESFFDQAESALGVRPTLISGDDEARLAFLGSTAEMSSLDGVVVSDIGGGSTEFVSSDRGVSIDIGSVRLTDRLLPDRPASPRQVDQARAELRSMFASVGDLHPRLVVGIAGTWTSLAAIESGRSHQDRLVHGYELSRAGVDSLAIRLSAMTVNETAELPGLDPKRAPVILSGAVIASEVARAMSVETVTVSVRDTLDGAASGLLDLP